MSVPDPAAYERVLTELRRVGMKVWESNGHARAQCPVHGSRGLTLAIRPPKKPPGTPEITCFAGCEDTEVLAELGMTLRDLYLFDPSQPRPPARPRPPTSPWDLVRDPEHLANRIQETETQENDPTYWDRRADELAAAHAHMTDFPGMDPDAEPYDDAAWLAGISPAVKRSIDPKQWRRVEAQIMACRNKARFLRMYPS